MSSLLTARDMNDDEGPKDSTPWVLIGKDNRKIVFRPIRPVVVALAGNYN
ncbi:MAG: hypothetical protein IT365_08175 [Candidatus Hydrogenedentes bacterium]|nr:hypothetical protein [Candidatus Hydrogenedentota bacterium]